jgi:hypothetical protein
MLKKDCWLRGLLMLFECTGSLLHEIAFAVMAFF